MDEIACTTDIKSLNLFNPDGGFSIKERNSELEEYWHNVLEESESDSRTGIFYFHIFIGTEWRNSEITYDFNEIRYLETHNAMSLAVNVGTKNESQFNQSLLANSGKLPRMRQELGTSSCQSWWIIF